MARITSILITLTLILSNCKKVDLQEPGPSKPGPDTVATEGKLDIVWKMPRADGLSQFSGLFDPILYQNSVIFNTGYDGSGSVLSSLDAETGKLNWSTTVCGEPGSNPSKENYLAVNCNEHVMVLNADQGNMVWQTKISDALPRIHIIGDYVYHTHSSPGLHWDYVHLVRSPPSYAQWDTVLTLYTDSLDGYRPMIESLALWRSPDGDSVLVFQNRSWNFDVNEGRIDFYAYNLTTGKVQFTLKDIEPSGNSNVCPILVDRNFAYFLGARSISCINLLSETVVWQKLFYGDGAQSFTSNLLIVDNKLIVHQDNSLMTAFDKVNGDIIWQQQNAGYTPSRMEYSNGVIYFTAEGDGLLMATDAANGKIIWSEPTPNEEDYPNAYFNGGVAITSKYLYTQDRYFIMCIKLPEK